MDRASIQPRPCEWCGQLFAPKTRRSARWCSAKCGSTARRRKLGSKPFRPAIVDGQKRCNSCGIQKPISEFSRRTDRNQAPLSHCKPCITRMANNYNHSRRGRNTKLMRTYGITLDRYEEILAHQGGLCPICRSDLGPTPHVDHCHTSGVVRGILCGPCNAALGLLRDDTAALLRAADYLLATTDVLTAQAVSSA